MKTPVSRCTYLYILWWFMLLFPICTHAQLNLTTTSIESRCTANGAILITPSGGTAPYTYRLDSITNTSTSRFPEIQDGNRFDALRPGSYRVTVTDKNRLTATTTVLVKGTYVLPTLAVSISGRTARMNVSGGRQGFRFTYSRNGTPSRDTSTKSEFRCLLNGDYLFILIDSCQNTFPYYTRVNVAGLDFTPRCNAGTVTAQSPSGGIKPYSFTLKNTVTGDSIINSSGTFNNLSGCTFTLTMRDSCGYSLSQPIACTSSPIQVKIVCYNSQNGTATLSASGGFPPYVFQEYGTGIRNNTGKFTGLPNTTSRRYFTVTDACGQVREVWVDAFYFDTPTFQACPFSGDLSLSSSQWRKDDPICASFCSGSFFPIRYECLNCNPVKVVIDSGAVGKERSSAIMRGLAEGTYQIRATTACGETLTKTVTLQRGVITLYVSSSCGSISAGASPGNGVKYYLKNGTSVLDSNFTGSFVNLLPGTYLIDAVSPTCGKTSKTVQVELSASVRRNCDSIVVDICPNIKGYTFTLKKSDGTILAMNKTGGFGKLPFGQNFTVEVMHESGARLATPVMASTSQMPGLRAVSIGFCSIEIGFDASTYYSIDAYNYPVVFQVYDNATNTLITTTNKRVISGLQPNRSYRIVAIQTPNVCGSQSLVVKTRTVDKPSFCIEPDYDLISSKWVPVWDLEVYTSSTNARLVNLSTKEEWTSFSFSQGPYFSDVLPGKYMLIRDECIMDTISLPEFPRNLNFLPRASCPQFGSISVRGALTDTASLGKFLRSVGWKYCSYPRLMEYRLYNEAGTQQIGSSNTSGDFTGLTPGRRYLACSFLGSAQISCQYVVVPPYVRSTISATPPALCPQDKDGAVTINIRNGVPPFIVEITNLGRKVVTDSSLIVIPNVPRGLHTLRVLDNCLISADFNISVGTVDPQLNYSNRTCDGQITLTATQYSAAQYIWRDSTGKVIGNLASISIQNDHNRTHTYALEVVLPRCTLNRTITIPASPSSATEGLDAGADETIREQLNAQLKGSLPSNSSGVWTALSNNPAPATFSDARSPNSKVTVPQGGRYGFVWTATTACETGRDTVFFSFFICTTKEFTQSFSICAGDSIQLGGVFYSSAGTYSDTLVAKNGCDSIVFTKITVSALPKLTLTDVTICGNNPSQVTLTATTTQETQYRWSTNATTITIPVSQSGLYTVTVTNSQGCSAQDSARVKFLSISKVKDDTICSGGSIQPKQPTANDLLSITLLNAKREPVTASKLSPTQTSNYFWHIKQSASPVCETFVPYSIVVRRPDTTILKRQTCQANQTSETKIILPNRFGCDSVVITKWTLIQPILVQRVDSTCNRALVGIRQDTFLARSTGCDSIIRTRIVLKRMTTKRVSEFSCDPKKVGTRIDTLFSIQSGCRDSIVIKTTTLIPAIRIERIDSTCNPLLVGVRIDTFQSRSTGCDSIIRTQTFLRRPILMNKVIKVCQANQAGVRVDTSFSTSGCPIITRTTAIYQKPETTSQSKILCAGDSTLFDGVYRKKTGLYRKTIKSKEGCDSLFLELQVTVRALDTASFYRRICEGDTIMFNGKVFSKTGVYQQSSQNTEGCLKIRTLKLEVIPNPDSDLQLGDTTIQEGQPFQLLPKKPANFQWFLPKNQLPCDSCFVIKPTRSSTYGIRYQDKNACFKSIKRFVQITKSKEHTPNGFAPPEEPFYRIPTPLSVKRILRVQIFARSGEMVYDSGENESAFDSRTMGWDGTYRGQPVQSAVFVVKLVVEFLDGKKGILAHDVTVFR